MFAANCSEKHWPVVNLHYIPVAVTADFAYCVPVEYSIGDKRVLLVA